MSWDPENRSPLRRQMVELVQLIGDPPDVPAGEPEALLPWLNRASKVLSDARKLIEETDEPEKLSPEAQDAYALAERLTGYTEGRRHGRVCAVARRLGLQDDEKLRYIREHDGREP